MRELDDFEKFTLDYCNKNAARIFGLEEEIHTHKWVYEMGTLHSLRHCDCGTEQVLIGVRTPYTIKTDYEWRKINENN